MSPFLAKIEMSPSETESRVCLWELVENRSVVFQAAEGAFLASTAATARYVYARGSAAGKRVQCQGGAKNPVIVMRLAAER
jgi:hypothetical protein